ncbi:CA216 protein, partial [Nycticryphes semicollaris]|nr:CA216 protein [Nycticryphes semicollaris]
MFAICPPGAPANAPFRGGPALGTASPGAGCGQDSNSNFVGEVCDSNENWSQPAPGSPPEEGSSQSENTTNPSDNLLLLMQRQMVQGRLRDTTPSLGTARPRLPEPGVRSPPEGAEVGGAGGQNATTEEPAEGCNKPLSSPMEDNGYASSSLSIDSPDSACGGAWDPPATAPRPGSPPQMGEPEPKAGTLFPALAEAVQHLQDKERFKEQEKEKHHIQLVMYRRLALLRWIHGLQQKVMDQQNRLQESFDTILDNRKELIRCMQHGPPCPAGTAAPSP